jgi:hypothetical protein
MAASLISNLDAIATNNTRPTTGNSNISGDANNTGPNFFASTDITAPHSGITTQKYTVSGSVVQALAYWDPAKWSTTPSGSTYYVRFYLYFTALPNASTALAGETTSAFSSKNLIRMTSAGKITVFNGSGTLAGTSTSTLPLSQWVRIEAQITLNATTGTVILRYYSSAESTTITETLTGTAGNTLGGTGTTSVERLFLGNNGGSPTTATHYYADAVWSDTNWIGPVLQSISDGDTVTCTDAISALGLGQNDSATGTEGATVNTGSTPISASDTATVTDAKATLNVTLSATETGTATDAKSVLTTSRTVSESAALTDASAGVVINLTKTDSDTVSVRDAATLVKSGTFFTPPTVIETYPFHGRVSRTQTTGVTVLKTGSSYVTVTDPLSSQWQAADIIYSGGRDYQIDPTEQAALVAAGYGSYISVKTIVG